MNIQSLDPFSAILRLDLPDPLSGGNKFFKLKYNVEEMRRRGKNALLTFGGAFSNHIAAVAAAGKNENFETIGVIRGEELHAQSNAVLRFAASCGMKLHFVSRDDYRKKTEPEFIAALHEQFGDFYLLPEGGSNEFAVKGCMEILPPEAENFDVIVCPVGTGATLAGIIASAKPHQEVTGIAVLNGENYLEREVEKQLRAMSDVASDITRSVAADATKVAADATSAAARWKILHDFTFGGYGKTTPELESFIASAKKDFDLPLDPVYSGKAFYAFTQMKKGESFRRKRLLFVHTGGYAFMDSLH